MKLSTTSLLFLFCIFSSFSAKALLKTTSFTTNKAVSEFVQKKKLNTKEKLGLWLLRRKLKKAKRQNSGLFQLKQTITDTTKCSTVYLQSGSELKAKIIEISDISVDLVRCGQSDTISLSKTDIKKITLFDGIKIYENLDFKTQKKPRPKKKPSDLSGFVAILIGFGSLALLYYNIPLAIFTGFIAIFFGMIGVNARHTRNKGIARFGGFVGVGALVVHRLRKLFRKPQ